MGNVMSYISFLVFLALWLIVSTSSVSAGGVVVDTSMDTAQEVKLSKFNNLVDSVQDENERKEYQLVSRDIVSIAKEYYELVNEIRDGNELSSEKIKMLRKLKRYMHFAQLDWHRCLKKIGTELYSNEAVSGRMQDLIKRPNLANDVNTIRPDTVIIDVVTGRNKTWIILTTPNVTVVRESGIGQDDLYDKVKKLRTVLESPYYDPLPQAQGLYHILIAPIANDLKQAGAKAILCELRGPLSHLPLGVLHDGHSYLLELYPIISFGSTSYARIKDAKPMPRILGVGVSKQHIGFAELPAVPSELNAVHGKILLDEAFTEKSLKDSLTNGGYNVLHMATHFVAGQNLRDSYLLLGDGTRLSLENLVDESHVFHGIDMLVLSACNTVMSGNSESGALLAIAQIQGAKSLVATMWCVADDSTSKLMQEFYKQLSKQRWGNHAEALRQAQLGLLSGSIPPSDRDLKRQEGNRGRRVQVNSDKIFPLDGVRPYSHPYYWAPFVYFGSLQ